MTQAEHHQVTFGESTIDFAVVRSDRRRTVSIAVDPCDGVILRAPTGLAGDRLDEVVRRKAPWILGRLSDFAEIGPPPAPREFVGGESYPYLGRNYRLKIERGGDLQRPEAALRGAYFVVALPPRLPSGERPRWVRRALVRWYRAHAKQRLAERVAIYTERLAVDTPPLLIRDQEKRWGSCNGKGELRFNWRIIMAPMSLVDYVVAHEVCHLEVRDHSAAFWKLLRTLMPDHETRKERLRRTGINYHL